MSPSASRCRANKWLKTQLRRTVRSGMVRPLPAVDPRRCSLRVGAETRAMRWSRPCDSSIDISASHVAGSSRPFRASSPCSFPSFVSWPSSRRRPSSSRSETASYRKVLEHRRIAWSFTHKVVNLPWLIDLLSTLRTSTSFLIQLLVILLSRCFTITLASFSTSFMTRVIIMRNCGIRHTRISIVTAVTMVAVTEYTALRYSVFVILRCLWVGNAPQNFCCSSQKLSRQVVKSRLLSMSWWKRCNPVAHLEFI